MANYWTKKDDATEELRTAKPWDEAAGHGDMACPGHEVASLRELAKRRYSVRSYTPEAVSAEDLKHIMECARLAPSAVNRQPWHFYVCQSDEALAKVRRCYEREWFCTAPMVIICCVCHDEEWVRASDGHAHGIVDVSIAAEHICLAATERGLGTCWVCNFDAQLCHELLCLPATQEPVVLLPIGHPSTSEIPTKSRKPQEAIVSIL